VDLERVGARKVPRDAPIQKRRPLVQIDDLAPIARHGIARDRAASETDDAFIGGVEHRDRAQQNRFP
jgi:hypothetical protein